jgi:transcriptional regulator with XRE-family HTH domain
MVSDDRRRLSRNVTTKQGAFLRACRAHPEPLADLLKRCGVTHGQLMKWMRGRSFRALLAELLEEFIQLSLLDKVICADLGRRVQVQIAQGAGEPGDAIRLSAAKSLTSAALQKHLLDALWENLSRAEDQIRLPHDPERTKELVGKLRAALERTTEPPVAPLDPERKLLTYQSPEVVSFSEGALTSDEAHGSAVGFHGRRASS